MGCQHPGSARPDRFQHTRHEYDTERRKTSHTRLLSRSIVDQFLHPDGPDTDQTHESKEHQRTQDPNQTLGFEPKAHWLPQPTNSIEDTTVGRQTADPHLFEAPDVAVPRRVDQYTAGSNRISIRVGCPSRGLRHLLREPLCGVREPLSASQLAVKDAITASGVGGIDYRTAMSAPAELTSLLDAVRTLDLQPWRCSG